MASFQGLIQIRQLVQRASCQQCSFLSCIFGLKEEALYVYLLLLKKGPLRSEDISELIDSSYSKTQRILSKLLNHDLVIRESVALENRSYYYLYHPVNQEEVKERISNIKAELDNSIEKFLSLDWKTEA